MKVNYKLDNNNYIIGLTRLPFDENKPFIEINSFDEIILHKTKIINNEIQVYSNILTKSEIRNELLEIQKWFDKNDWKINKIVIGEWEENDIRWINYLNERKEKRERQDELNILLSSQLKNVE